MTLNGARRYSGFRALPRSKHNRQHPALLRLSGGKIRLLETPQISFIGEDPFSAWEVIHRLISPVRNVQSRTIVRCQR